MLQIETVSVIVHTRMTSLFKGAQVMKYAVCLFPGVKELTRLICRLSIDVIVLCCNKLSSTAMFLCIVYITLQN